MSETPPRPLVERLRDELLYRHVGRRHGITSALLAVRLGTLERDVRKAVTELREAGIAVCGLPASGYFIAETEADLEETCQFLRSRSLHSLKLEATLRKIALPKLIGQVAMDLQHDSPSPFAERGPGGEARDGR